jgi:hypothetical protein
VVVAAAPESEKDKALLAFLAADDVFTKRKTVAETDEDGEEDNAGGGGQLGPTALPTEDDEGDH